MQRYTTQVNHILRKEILNDGYAPLFNEALALSLQGGKRLRPMISLEIAHLLGKGYDIQPVAIVSELIHTASLVIDDLPCMDNDTERRGLPTIHHKYGERRAQVVTTHLFSKAYTLLYHGFRTLEENGLDRVMDRKLLIFDTLSKNLGILGAPMGQFMDTCADPMYSTGDRQGKEQHFTDLIDKKTATLFEIAFVIGYVAGGGDLSHIESIRQCSRHFGIAFQISDDFQDTKRDANQYFCPNFVNHLGKETALQRFNQSLEECQQLLEQLDLHSPLFKELLAVLRSRVLNS